MFMIKRSSFTNKMRQIRLAKAAWLPLALFVLSAADVFAIVFPIEGLTVAAVLRRPRQWIQYGLALSLGTTLGCWSLGELTFRHSGWVLDRFAALSHSGGWVWMQTHLQTLATGLGGAGLVLAGSFTPIPLQVLVIVPALAGMPPVQLYVALALGRLLRGMLLCWGASRAPGLLSRFKGAKRELAELESPDEPPSPQAKRRPGKR